MSTDPSGNERDYTMLRVPRHEYERIVQAREQFRQSNDNDRSYIGQLALGAFVGFLAGFALSELGNQDQPPRRRNTRRVSRSRRR